jgi:preprotein translocase subunit SecD
MNFRNAVIIFFVVLFGVSMLRGADEKPLANGIYAVVREASTEAAAKPGRVMPFEKRYIAVSTASFIPLSFAEAPMPSKDERGRTALNGVLAEEQVKPFEAFTRAQLEKNIAVVVDGKIIAAPKLRSVITDGHVKITGCEDDGCQDLQRKLTK